MKTALITLAITIVFAITAFAAPTVKFACPAPDLVKCVPGESVITNNTATWKANGGQMTGNSYSANNQCANVISLPGSQNRLLCCYTKCGVFYTDVPYSRCTKLDTANFICN